LNSRNKELEKDKKTLETEITKLASDLDLERSSVFVLFNSIIVFMSS
jgi:hypothetical protein